MKRAHVLAPFIGTDRIERNLFIVSFRYRFVPLELVFSTFGWFFFVLDCLEVIDALCLTLAKLQDIARLLWTWCVIACQRNGKCLQITCLLLFTCRRNVRHLLPLQIQHSLVWGVPGEIEFTAELPGDWLASDSRLFCIQIGKSELALQRIDSLLSHATGRALASRIRIGRLVLIAHFWWRLLIVGSSTSFDYLELSLIFEPLSLWSLWSRVFAFFEFEWFCNRVCQLLILLIRRPTTFILALSELLNICFYMHCSIFVTRISPLSDITVSWLCICFLRLIIGFVFSLLRRLCWHFILHIVGRQTLT